MRVRSALTLRQKMFATVLHRQTAFLRWFWQNEITLPPSTRQKCLWNDESERVLLCTGRKSGKTLYIEGRVIRKSLIYRGKSLSERMFFTPGDNQINPTRERLITKIQGTPLFRMMLKGYNKNEGTLNWHTRVIWHIRIEGSFGDDRNMVGLRLEEQIGDEMAFSNLVCHRSRMQSALPGCKWLYCGVPNGVRHTPFWALDQSREGKSWSRHKTSTFTNPLYWPEKTRDQLIEDYGRGTQDFITQVMGGWGEEVFSSFPPGALAIDDRLPYRMARIQGHEIPLEIDAVTLARLAAKLRLPRLPEVYQYVIGYDYGYLQDPGELGVAYRLRKEDTVWKMLFRIEILGANPLAQGRLFQFVGWFLGENRIARACLDMSHAGIAVATHLRELPDWGSYWNRKLFDFNANGVVAVDPRGENEDQPPLSREQMKKVRRKVWFTQKLQAALLAARTDMPADVALWLGKDPELEQELVDTREKKTEAGNIVYIPRNDGHKRPVDHATDMLRGIVAAALLAQEDTSEGEYDEEWAGAVGFTEHSLFPAPVRARSPGYPSTMPSG